MVRDHRAEGSEPEQRRYSETERLPRESTLVHLLGTLRGPRWGDQKMRSPVPSKLMHCFGTLPGPRWGAKKMRSPPTSYAIRPKKMGLSEDNSVVSSSPAAKKVFSWDLNEPMIDEEEAEFVNSLPVTQIKNRNYAPREFKEDGSLTVLVGARSELDENDLALVERARNKNKKVKQIK